MQYLFASDLFINFRYIYIIMYLWLWLAFTALAGATDVGKLLSVLIEVINNMH